VNETEKQVDFENCPNNLMIQRKHTSNYLFQIVLQIAGDLIMTYTNKDEEISSILVKPAPSVRDFSDDSTLATIRWHCMPLIQLLWKQQSTTQHVRYAIDLVIERSSLYDWQLRCDFLLSILATIGPDSVKGKEITYLVAMVRSVVQGIFSSSLMKGVKESYHLLAVEEVGEYRSILND
jgi:hypothetical protein